ncbi:MAG: hypothetical protein R3B94_04750 [Hyphomonas sp.]
MSLIISGSSLANSLRQFIVSPAGILFISSNITNAANLFFNMLFARLLGPELFSDLALLLTLKLSAFALVSAVQLGCSKVVAAQNEETRDSSSAIAGMSKLSLSIALPFCALIIIFSEAVAAFFSLENVTALIIVTLGIPALVPLSLYRGEGLGRLKMSRIVMSFQFEWITRLFGAVALWYAGVGLIGIALALTASVYIAAIFASGEKDRAALLNRQTGALDDFKLLLTASLPLATIQIAQVMVLDGDFFIAKALLTDHEAGYVAALGLVQRIFFFAFSSFAMLIVPMASKSFAGEGDHDKKGDLFKMVFALAALAVLPLGLVTAFGELFVYLLFGSSFIPIGALSGFAAATAICFSVVHLIVSYLVAIDKQFAAIVLIKLSIILLAILSYVATLYPSVTAIIVTKFIFMCAIALLALSVVRWEAA